LNVDTEAVSKKTVDPAHQPLISGFQLSGENYDSSSEASMSFQSMMMHNTCTPTFNLPKPSIKSEIYLTEDNETILSNEEFESKDTSMYFDKTNPAKL